MLDSVVVGVDGSPAGRSALRWAGRHAPGDVHLVHAVSPAIELLEAGFQIDTTGALERARADLADAWTAETGLPDDRVRIHVIEDNPARALIDTANRFGVDAIVIGANGRDHIGGLVGANTGRLIHLSEVPMIVVPTDAVDDGDHDDRVVVAVRGDAQRDRQLIDWARRFAGDRHALDLVYSIGTKATASDTGNGSDAATEMEHWMRELLGPTGTDDRTTVSTHDPLTTIVDASESSPLTVIGSYRSSRVGGFLTGAIAQHLPAVNPCPVAVIPLTTSET